MKTSSTDTSQTMQRVRVGMTGLASVLVLIGLGAAVFRSVNTEPPVAAVGAPKPEVVENMTSNAPGNTTAAEPLAELGVAPGASVGNSTAAPAR